MRPATLAREQFMPPYYSSQIHAGLDLGAGRFKGYYTSKSEAEFFSGGSPHRAFATPNPHAARPPRFGRRAVGHDTNESDGVGMHAVLPLLPSPPKALPVPLPPFAPIIASASHESLRQRPDYHYPALPPRGRQRVTSTDMASAPAAAEASTPSPSAALNQVSKVDLVELYASSPDPTALFLRRKYGRREGFGRRRYAE
jgi:hypothetical protein